MARSTEYLRVPKVKLVTICCQFICFQHNSIRILAKRKNLWKYINSEVEATERFLCPDSNFFHTNPFLAAPHLNGVREWISVMRKKLLPANLSRITLRRRFDDTDCLLKIVEFANEFMEHSGHTFP